MDKDVSTYLKQILDAIILVEEYITDVSRDKFLNSKQIQDSVAMRLHLIGEICNKLPDSFTRGMPEIPWDEIVGLRNLIAHRYLEITQETVWNTIKQDLPVLKQAFFEALKKFKT